MSFASSEDAAKAKARSTVVIPKQSVVFYGGSLENS